MRRAITRSLQSVALAAALVIVTAGPAFADPAKPTNDRSTVATVDPPAPGVEAAIVGGDTFLRITVQSGHVVTVLGYENEPYLRFNADGTIDENTRSPAVSLNKSRYGNTTAANADAKATPEWHHLASGGQYEWHDHRIHWMGRSKPPQLGAASTGLILNWVVPIVADGQTVSIKGSLTRVAAPSSIPWWIVALLLGAVGAVALRGRPIRFTATAFAVTGIGLTLITTVMQLEIPNGAGRHPSSIVLAGLVAAVSVAALAIAADVYRQALLDSAALVATLWVWRNHTVIGHAVLPSSLSPFLQRAAVAIAVAVVIVRLVQRIEPVIRPVKRTVTTTGTAGVA